MRPTSPGPAFAGGGPSASASSSGPSGGGVALGAALAAILALAGDAAQAGADALGAAETTPGDSSGVARSARSGGRDRTPTERAAARSREAPEL